MLILYHLYFWYRGRRAGRQWQPSPEGLGSMDDDPEHRRCGTLPNLFRYSRLRHLTRTIVLGTDTPSIPERYS